MKDESDKYRISIQEDKYPVDFQLHWKTDYMMHYLRNSINYDLSKMEIKHRDSN